MKNYKKAEDISPSMCIMPWIGLATDASGGIRSCCWMEAITDKKFLGDPKEYKSSEYLKEIKQTFLNGEYPSTCHRCKQDDRENLISKRKRENAEWESKNNNWNYLQDDFSVIDLRLSNVCNLGCVMCGPKSSSFIENETKENLSIAPLHNYRQYNGIKNLNLLNPYTDDQIDEIIDLIGPSARIYCTGGEPSLNKKTTKLLEVLLDKGYNKTIKLQFNSNFQTLNQKWFDLLKEFKGDMLPSLDGVGKTAEYVRYPCDWNKIDNNLREFISQCGKTWNIKVMPTVSIVSIFGLKDLYRWWYDDIQNEFDLVKDSLKSSEKAMRVQVNNRLITPNIFDIKNLPEYGKQKAIEDIDYIVEKYQQYFQSPIEKKYFDDIKQQLSRVADNNKFAECIETLNKFDNIRNLEWKHHLTGLNAVYKNK